MRARLNVAGLAAVLALAVPSFALAQEMPAAPPAAAPAADSESPWFGDFDKAVEQARKEKKDLLVDFTGSDWCHWCIKLHEEVFAHEDFLAAARKDFVLVVLDFPNTPAVKAKVPNPDRNASLAHQYGIQGYPTVLLMSPDGEVYGRTGYQEGGSEAYIPHLAKLRSEGVPALKESKDLAAAIQASKGADLAAACDKAFAALEGLPEDSGLGVVRILPVKAALAADADNKAGIGAKAALALMKAGAADEAVLASAGKFDPKNEQGLLERVVAAKGSMLRSLDDVKTFVKSCEDLFAAGPVKDKLLGKQMAANCMFMNHKHLKDPAAAKAWAKKVLEFGLTEGDPMDARLKTLLDEVMAVEEKPAAPPTDK